jgi:hypothetical protein
MSHASWTAALLIGVGLTLAPGATALAASPHHAAASAASDVDPASIKALGAMGAYLRTLSAFEVKAATVREELDDAGQKLQFTGTTTYKVRRPNGFVIEVAEDRRIRQVYYDGHSLTLFAPRMGFYAHVPAPPTIRETLQQAADKYDIELPLVDLFKWGEGDDGTKLIRSGYEVGYAKIDGQDTEQYAFRQRGVDWQIWIRRGDQPLPLRVVVTSTDDHAQPQFEADLTWNTAPQYADNDFVFQPPADAKAIGIASR